MSAPRCAVVTGCAGFVGSHLTEQLVAEGWRVTGIDCFTPSAPREEKLASLAGLADEPSFDLVEGDLATLPLEPLLAGAACVFHLAGRGNVHASFGRDFAVVARDNVAVTQAVLAAGLEVGCPRVVWASSSSVYGEGDGSPSHEERTPACPRSPYGVTKHACEHLARVYRDLGLATVGLRYFTVYGPRQRPDMAIRRICEALLCGGSFVVAGDGWQARDFTYVGDACEATVRAAKAVDPYELYNVGGGGAASLREVIGVAERLADASLAVEFRPPLPGDVRRTSADTVRARESLGWQPSTTLEAGLERQLAWSRSRLEVPAAA